MTREDKARVQDLCRQLMRLVSLSHEQRRAIDRLMGELNALARKVERRPRGADADAAGDRPLVKTATSGPRSR